MYPTEGNTLVGFFLFSYRLRTLYRSVEHLCTFSLSCTLIKSSLLHYAASHTTPMHPSGPCCPNSLGETFLSHFVPSQSAEEGGKVGAAKGQPAELRSGCQQYTTAQWI